MGKSAPSPPKPPDYTKLVQEQSKANLEALVKSAGINAVDVYAPWGSTTFERNPDGTPKSQNINLSPEQQALFGLQTNLAQAMAGGAVDAYRRIPTGEFNFNGLPGAPGQGDFTQWGNQISDAQYQRAMDLMRPEFDRRRNELEQRLADRGLPMSGENYQGEMSRFDRAVNEAQLGAARDALLSSGNEQSRMFGLAQTSRDKAIAEALMQRNQPYNELAMLQGGPQMPLPNQQQLPAYQLQPADTMGAANMVYQGQMNRYNAQMANYQSNMQGLMGLAGAGLSLFSSIDYKDRIGEAPAVLEGLKALPVDVWAYKWDGKPHIGVYAEDFASTFGLGDGKTIDAVDAIGVLFKAVKELAAKVDALAAKG